jgi:LCP family protein required for cell wall assembly
VIGLDPRPKRRSLGRPDTLILVSLPEDSKGLGLASIPRDLYLEIPGHGFDRINAVFGAAHRNGDDPLKLVRRVVARALKVRVDHTVVVDLGLFERGVDLLGKVTVEVPCPIMDNFLDHRTPTGRRLLDVKAGPQEMDGLTAGMYVRSRHGRSDWSRARRQQAVLMAMRRRFLTVGGLARLPGFWSELSGGIVTDMPRIEIFGLAARLAAVPAGEMHGIVLGHLQTRSWRSPEGRSVLLPDDRAIRKALMGLFGAPWPGLRPRGSPCPPADAALAKPRARLAFPPLSR